MPKVVGKSVTVVDHDGLTIQELTGNVATRNDALSIAHVTVSQPTSEPWLTLQYDEWICVTKGMLELHTSSGGSTCAGTGTSAADDNTNAGHHTKEGDDQHQILTVLAGETAFVEKGTRFKPVFPQGDTEYIPVCLPAFSPERCLREEQGNGASEAVSAKLRLLHNTAKQQLESSSTSSRPGDNSEEEVLYHMCQERLWKEAVANRTAYFPPTFETDGMFTHATAVPQRLVTTANHFYTETPGNWICLQLSKSALEQVGIKTVFEHAKPVGATETSQEWDWVCPHIYGGIPTTIQGIVSRTFEMKRKDDDGTFVSIIGLTD